MKKLFLLLLAALTQPMSAFGDTQPQKTFTTDQKQLIAAAIKILADSGTLRADANKCAQFDGDLIDDLKKNGLLTIEDSENGSVCVGASKAKKE